MGFQRVSLEQQCPICGKPDWCLLSQDKQVAICSRIESPKLAGRAGAGWLHFLDEHATSRSWRQSQRSSPSVATSGLDLQRLADECHAAMKPAAVMWLSDELGVEPNALRDLRTGWNASRKAWSFPMREPNGAVSGIRYRAANASKFSEKGGREGLFFVPRYLESASTLCIVEGASDTASLLSLGITNCVGRSSCNGNSEQLVNLSHRLEVSHAVIIPDNDEPGIRGAEKLKALLGNSAELLPLPRSTKDVRECIQSDENAAWLSDMLQMRLKSCVMEGGADQ